MSTTTVSTSMSSCALTPVQAGHLRHFHNLATQTSPHPWAYMGSQDPQQEWLDAYRYQVAIMCYAPGAAHYHRLPGVREPMQVLIEALVERMTRREVWGYWYLTSQSGVKVDPDLKQLRKPWADPVKEENIMYSGHLLLMVSLHSMLFASNKYDDPTGLTFVHAPIFWGLSTSPEKFSYKRMSLQKVVWDEMEKHGWLGCPCEPNAIFVVCNQFPLIAMRYNDIREGTDLAEEAIAHYRSAWPRKNDMLAVPSDGVGFSAWAGAFMHASDPVRCRELYATQRMGFFTRLEGGRLVLNEPPVAGIPTLGYVAQWLSELDTQRLDALLKHVDASCSPTWEKGGLFYPSAYDSDVKMDPFTGNAAIGYAHLNVENGQRRMWEEPWDDRRVRGYPALVGITFADGVDFLRGLWDEKRNAFVLSLRSWSGEKIMINPSVIHLPTGTYGMYVDGELKKEITCQNGEGRVDLELTVDAMGLDMVLLMA
ncbi:hypothetical protein DACRYDRAFT_89084 [Dacryopinax primogenitus]|uniref:Linalool dehydratase/isomerase domain-containing protein n=1 Tax=Dacryopinax primogenitus (strain DJM 731) TaxID=1858805 RepID=M5FXN4_DACPD|nr:uncharacterized protein DACRYDRAFT_89084 [Dacryopinax primogenitus]EJU01244.1 hypothetical protein DACRYDRAFT_89084 [Dacryopinax primogenitus]